MTTLTVDISECMACVGTGHEQERGPTALPPAVIELAERNASLQVWTAAYAAGDPVVADADYDRTLSDLRADVHLQIQALQSARTNPSRGETESNAAALRTLRALSCVAGGVGTGIRSGAAPAAHTPECGGRLLSLRAEHSTPAVRRWFDTTVAPALAPAALETAGAGAKARAAVGLAGERGAGSVAVQQGCDITSLGMALEPKIDGLTLRVTYQDGRLLQVRIEAVTVPWQNQLVSHRFQLRSTEIILDNKQYSPTALLLEPLMGSPIRTFVGLNLQCLFPIAALL